MNSIVSPDRLSSTGRILFIEPDSGRATTLRGIFRQDGNIDVEIVGSVPAALRSLAVQIPDLLLTSTFLPPADEASLTAHVKGMPAARHLPMITVPYFVDAEEASRSETSNAKVLTFLGRRPGWAPPRCDVRTLREQIEGYLSHARKNRLEADSHLLSDPSQPWDRALAPRPKTHEMCLTRPGATTGAVLSSAADTWPLAVAMPTDRRRARRLTGGDVPWLWTIKVPGASKVSVVDISSGGVLLEMACRMADGSTVDLQLLGKDTNVSVPARMLRSQVAAVDGLGVKYRVAVAFTHDLALPGLQQALPSSPMPKVLADLLSRVLSEVDRCSGEAALRISFERELRRILPLRDVQIRQTPVIAERGAESVYFTVPHGSGARPILQATYEPNYAPTAMEFSLLRAAASLAAVVLEFAPRASLTR